MADNVLTLLYQQRIMAAEELDTRSSSNRLLL